MPLENRADPTGELFKSPTRGLFTGNRGIIHDPDSRTRLGRRWSTQGWICCTLAFGKRRRDVWGRNRPGNKVGWSELFFLDEVTALAAGHRPCFFCRHKDAQIFRAAWVEAAGISVDAPTMDRALHGERWHSRRSPPQLLKQAHLAELPDGAVIEADGQFYALKHRRAFKWDFAGYGISVGFMELPVQRLRLVTPPSILKVLQTGYQPLWHESANQTPS